MVSVGDDALEFTNKVANGDVEEFTLSERVDDGSLVLAFFPGAFTPPCTNEMTSLEEHIDEFEEADASVYGLSADSPFTLNAFREEYDLSFPLVSNMSRETIQSYDLEIDVEELGLHGVANRAVYVVNDDSEITYAWEADEPDNEPEYDELLGAVGA
ncbi:redoxin domain-containing protein [Haloprofundus salilacus]|uniref:redoxin domain-containing protein n=1 Tax=Haloprofundus salilacus TaxID=2876190 RepID=UPI001CCA8790|nr:redoxin domain-containing protein [Haloprofundus salilacus]